MVVKYTKSGTPVLSPPYTAAEKAEISKGLNDTPMIVGRYRRPQGQPQKQPQEEPHPGEREQT